MRCSRSKTPACCHLSRRRQQVCPEPNPSSRGSSCQAMPLWSTYRMPCRHSRSATGRGPGDRSGQGGNSGSISVHKSSSTIHGRALTPSRTAESSHRSRPARTPQQDRVTSSKGLICPVIVKPPGDVLAAVSTESVSDHIAQVTKPPEGIVGLLDHVARRADRQLVSQARAGFERFPHCAPALLRIGIRLAHGHAARVTRRCESREVGDVERTAALDVLVAPLPSPPAMIKDSGRCGRDSSTHDRAGQCDPFHRHPRELNCRGPGCRCLPAPSRCRCHDRLIG